MMIRSECTILVIIVALATFTKAELMPISRQCVVSLVTRLIQHAKSCHICTFYGSKSESLLGVSLFEKTATPETNL